MIEVRARIEETGTEQMKLAQRELRNRVKAALKESAQRAVLPRAKRAAPAIVAQALTTKATSTRAYLTTIGPRKWDRITGLLNWGGTVRTSIEPDRKTALRLRGTDIIVSAVTTPRKYKGKRFLERALAESVPEMERISLRTVMKAFE